MGAGGGGPGGACAPESVGTISRAAASMAQPRSLPSHSLRMSPLPILWRETSGREITEARHLSRLLCRTTSGRAAEKRDEVAPLHHSITSSARASSVGGTSMPSALAVLRLITSSYLVGCSTGMSAGFVPFKIL